VLYWSAVIADHPTDELDPQEQSVIKRSPARGGRSVKVSFILPKDGGGVSVVADFNDWDPHAHPLRPRSNGTRSVAVTLQAGGRYAFRYLAEGGHWHDDAAADAFEPNGAGGFNSILET
jgi:Carbohydrate-binding module 48 (Isoamylase N-terminal domain)